MKFISITAVFIIIFSFFVNVTIAQETSCYNGIRNEGLTLARQGKYDEAINRFFAARYCLDKPAKDDLDEQIRRAQQLSKKQLQEALDAARQAEAEAIAAKEAEAVAAKEAEANAKFAQEQGRRSEGLRLLLLSDNARLQNKKSDAFWLSFSALQLLTEDIPVATFRAFGEAVKDSLEEVIWNSNIAIQSLEYLYNNEVLITKLSDGSVRVLKNKEEQLLKINPQFNTNDPVIHSINNENIILYASKTNFAIATANGLTQNVATPHQDWITFAAFSHGGQKVITCSRDNTAILWDAQAKPIKTLSHHRGNIYKADFSYDDTYALLRSSDGTVSLWDADGNYLRSIGKDEIYIYDVTFSKHDNHLVTAAASGIAKLWNIDGTLLATLPHGSPVKQAFFSPNGQQIITIGLDNAAKVWDLQGKLIATLQHHDHITDIHYNTDGSLILSASKDTTAVLWDSKGTRITDFIGHNAEIISAILNADNQHILTTSKDGSAILWDLQGNIIMNIELNSENPLPAEFSKDNHYIITVENNNQIIKKYPIPSQVFQNITSQNWQNDSHYQKVKKEYDIQFVGEGN
ncbi:MAG: WD40 repeat domain-containing protein [Saprospiraceae bacterium]|nr:WD40 repeat domain-containing protein [Saprospiraceae bacterium]